MPPIANYIKSDLDSLDYVVTGAPVVAGTPVLISPGFYGIPANDASIGSTVALRVRGIFAIDKASPAASFSVGTMLEYNGTTGLQVGSGSGTFRVMAPCASGDKKVCVRINVEVGPGGGGGGGPATWGFITGTLSAQVDLQSALDGKAATSHVHSFASITGKPTTLSGYGIVDAQPLDSDLTAISALTTTAYGRDFLTLADGTALAAKMADNTVALSRLANAAAGAQLLGRGAGGAGPWQPITLGTNLAMSGSTLNATGGGGGGGATVGVVQIKCTGSLSTDNAAISAGISAAQTYGDGVEIQLCPSDDGVHRELNSSVDMSLGTLSYKLRGMPGFEGIVNHSTNTVHSTILTGATYNPWDLPNPATLPLGIAANKNIVSDPSIQPTVGKCYAFWSDDENLDIARHDSTKPQRCIELHRISRQVKERCFRLTITATGGTFTLTGAGATATANIAVTATATDILNAINAVRVPPVTGAFVNVSAAWRVEVISAGVFRLWTAAGQTLSYTMTANAAGATGGTVTCALDSSPTLINKWEIEDTTFRPFLTNAKMVEIPMVSGILIENVNIRNAPGVAPAGSSIALCGAYRPTIRNCRLGDEFGRGNPGQLYTLFCYGASIENVWICDHDDPDTYMSSYYGMLEGCCNGVRRIGCTMGAVRHGFTSGGREQTIGPTTYRYGGSLNPVFDSCMFHANVQYGPGSTIQSAPMWDCHAEIARATVQNSLFLIPNGQVGFHVRAQGVTLANNTFHCENGGTPGYVRAPDFTMLGGEIIGGSFAIEVYNHQNVTQKSQHPLRARFLDVTWKDSWGPVLRIRSGDDLQIDGCKFLRTGAGYTNTPFTESCAIYVEGLSDSSSTLSITNCHAPKHLNKWFLYAPSLTFAQLYYAGNTGMQTYGGTSIGIARLRRNTGGTDPSGAQGSTITATVEWEMAYGILNGHPIKYQYRQKTGHGFTSADDYKPIVLDISGTPAYSIYDNTVDQQPIGLLIDIPYEGSTDTDNFIVIAPEGATLEIPKSMLNGTHAAGTDKPTGYWNLALGKYEVTKPAGSHANATPVIDIGAFTASLMQVTVNPSGVAYVNTGAFGESWLAATAAADAVALLTSTPLTVASAAAGAFINSSSRFITQSGTARTLSAGDNGKIILCTNAGATTITVPTGLPVGFSCKVIRTTSGTVTFAASSTTINSGGGLLAISAQNRSAEIVSTATNVFYLDGSLS